MSINSNNMTGDTKCFDRVLFGWRFTCQNGNLSEVNIDYTLSARRDNDLRDVQNEVNQRVNKDRVNIYGRTQMLL